MQERCVITYLLGNETKDSTTETKLPKSKTSFEMSRELHSSKTVPCRKSFMPQGHRSSSSQQWCFFVQELGFALELFQDYNSISRPMKFLQTPPLSVPSHCTPTNHYFKSPVSADAHEKGQRSKDWPGSSKPCTAAPWLQAHFRDPNTADQTKDKVTCSLIPSTAETHTQKSTDPDEAAEVPWLQLHLHEHSNGRGLKRNSNLPDSSWASHKEIYSFTTEEVLCFSGGRQQTCPKQMPTWFTLCFCWLKTIAALHLSPQP